MTGLGCTTDTLNKSMSYLFWIVICGIVSGAIYWIMDWKQHHPDGE